MSTDRVIVSLYWKALKHALANGQWIAGIFVFLLSFTILFLLQNGNPDVHFMQLDRSNLLSVMGSVLASSIFFVVTEFITRARGVRVNAEREYFESMFLQFGVQAAYSQRGDQSVMRLYNELLRSARLRIWAVGITNHRFTQQHKEVLADRFRSCPGIDIRVCFLDPNAKLRFDERGSIVEETLPQIQNNVEKDVRSAEDFVVKIDKYIGNLTSLMNSSVPKAGRIRIYKLTNPCYFTCFIIDDIIFFFPMLARQESGQDPTMQVTKSGVLGAAIYQHFDKMMEAEPYARVVFDSGPPAAAG